MSKERKAFQRMKKRILEHSQKTGTNLTERDARRMAAKIAERHDRKNSGS